MKKLFPQFSRIFLAMLGVCLFFGHNANAQNRETFYPDYLFIKTKTYQATTKAEGKRFLVNEMPFLKKAFSLQEPEYIEQAFYFSSFENLRRFYRIKLKNGQNADSLVRVLNSLPEIEYAERIPIYSNQFPEKIIAKNSNAENTSVTLALNDPFYGDAAAIPLTNGGTLTYGNKWYLDQIKAEQALALQTGNSAVNVAVVDGAVYSMHEDLNIVKQYNAEDKTTNSNPPTSTGDAAYEWSHGTHCAGLIAANNNNWQGISSIASGVSLIGVKTGRNSDGSLLYFWDGVVWAIENGAHVLSLSVGSFSYSLALQEIIDAAYEKNIVVLAAAGNENVTMRSYPAAYNHVIAVASLSANDKKSDFSNFGDWVDIAAPGGNLSGSYYQLLSTTYVDASYGGLGIAANERNINGNAVTGKYHMMAGTSMATPIAAGVVALMKSANPNLNPDQIEALLKSSADPVYSINQEYSGLLGAGRINAYKAILAVKTNPLIALLKSSENAINPQEKITFKDISLGSPTSWKWFFEGGTPQNSTLQNPVIAYDSPGDFDVQLIAINGTSSDTFLLQDYIHVGTQTVLESQDTRFDAPSRGINYISVVDKNTVWANAYDGANTNNTIRELTRTSDGGKSWKALTLNVSTSLGVGMVHAIDSLNAWVPLFPAASGVEGGIFKTADGGKTWDKQTTATFTGSNAFANVVYFWNKNEGFCMGDPNGGYFEVYHTSNGGINWTRAANTNNVLSPINSTEYGTVGFFSVADDGTVFFSTNKGRLYKSTDKGVNWQAFQTPFTANFISAFSSKTNGLIANPEDGKLYRTINGGQTWEAIAPKGVFYGDHMKYIPLSNNSFVSSSADGEANVGLSFSRDGGLSWIDIPELTETQCLEIGFADITTGWIGQFNVDSVRGGIIKYKGPSTFVNFTQSAPNACINAEISFTDQSSTTQTVNNYVWNFGDNATPATANGVGPHKVKYSTTGTKVVSLTVNDVYSLTQSLNVNPEPIAGTLAVDKNLVCGHDSATITLSGYLGSVNWWESADGGNTFTLKNQNSVNDSTFNTKAIADTMHYLAIVTTAGCPADTALMLEVPVSVINASFTNNEGSRTVIFTNTSENAVSWNWTFGDNQSSTEQNPTHVFATSGYFNVKLSSTNADACAHSITKQLNVFITSIPNHLSDNLKVYPNPVNDVLHLEWNTDGQKNLEYEIVSTLGAKVASDRISAAQQGEVNTILLPKIPSGIYIFVLKENGILVGTKLIRVQ